MPLNLDVVAAISKAVALEHGRGLQVAGVTFSDGGGERVEILVTIAGCHSGACRFAVNITRADGAEFEREFRAKLHDALLKHQAPQP
jgi:hypothetical protein